MHYLIPRALACDTGTQLSGRRGAPRHDRQRLLIAREADGVANGSRGIGDASSERADATDTEPAVRGINYKNSSRFRM